MIYKEGEKICTGRIKGQRYEIRKAERGACGSGIDNSYCECHFFNLGDCESNGGFPLCDSQQVYFIKIQEK